MSVINRMLRDLDQRQHHPGSTTYTPAATAPQPLHWGWLVAVALGTAVVVIGALLIWWWVNTNTVESGATPAMPSMEPVRQLAAQAVADEPAANEPAVNEPATEPLREDVEQAAAQPAEPEPEVTVAAAKTQPQANVKPESTSVAEPEPEPAQSAARESSFEKKPVQLTPQQLADNNLEKARSALRKGEREKAQELLEKALIVMPDHVAVRSELAAYWFGRGLATRALALLRQGLERQPMESQWQLLYARILDRMGNVEDAYGTLRNINPDAGEYPELLQLRAVAANQLGHFDQAAADYTTLAIEQPRGRWWLAAAAAYEDAGNIVAALRAYQQAVNAGDLTQEGRSYAEQRLYALGGL
ncbi:tetratricopeptide repeat protein [Pseudidiomarina sp.]|uniref:tetratricopeptide repeat protein n=1 Tax=Pseudidiomarina sp. TaxID=2081707 RepID=UPI00299EE029|nr:tetratricopeptide repeat protein [Pseudidiomarina sp.]MDX1706307.1 hypothetical protein [Pseudidiomarina sp.]